MTMTQSESTTSNGEAGEKSRQQMLNKAYGAASTRLRAAHKQEFEDLYVAEAQALGVDYTPRRTPEQRAAAELTELLSRFPHLREQV